MSWLTLAVSILALLRWMASFWSDTAMLNRWKLALERKKAQQQVEAERLKATYERIQREPPTSGAQLADDLNASLTRLREEKAQKERPP